MKICPKCGKKNDKENIYCENCGALLAGVRESNIKTINRMTSIVVILAVLLIAGGGLLLGKSIASNIGDKDIAVSIDQDGEVTDGVFDQDGVTTGDDINSDDSLEPVDSSTDEFSVNWTVAANTVSIDANVPRNAVTFNEHSYYIFDNGCESWNEARRYCESRGGYIAVINSSKENEFLYQYMLSIGFDEVFFGYTDQYHEGYWEWVPGKTSYFTDWGINNEGSVEPNADSVYEDFAHMNSAMHNGHWNDKNFGKTTSCYFCEWDLISYEEGDRKGIAAEDAVPMRNKALNEADVTVKLKQGEEVHILFLLTEDNGDQWYYVRHKDGVDGYIKASLLNTK